MKIRCPRCRNKLTLADKYAGMVIRCPSCNRPISVPKPQAAVGGTIGRSDIDLDDLAALESRTTEMSEDERVDAESSLDPLAGEQPEKKGYRTCPHCHNQVKEENPSAEILCSQCWEPIPAVLEGEGLGGPKTGPQQAPGVAGKGGFYAGLAASVAYPIPALSSLLTAAGVAFAAALIPVAAITVIANLLEQHAVGTAEGVQKADLSLAQLVLIGVFSAEVFFFCAVAIHSFFDVVRTSSIRDDKPPKLSFSINHWGESFLAYLILCAYLVAMTYAVAKITIEADFESFFAKGDFSGLLALGGTPFIVGMVIVSFFIPMNLLGISLGTIIQALNPVNVVKSAAKTHVHYVFLVLILLVYGGLFGYAFAWLLFDEFVPQVGRMFTGSTEGDIFDVAVPLLVWGALMAFFFYGTYILARLHGLFARSFRKDLMFGTR